jgi:YesN/AraC family two-component response regulator
VAILVEDTGIGIPPDTLDHVFDRFYQVDGSHTRAREGTGIGLALTKELVELHHGSISVTSELGLGTCFNVQLPLGTAAYHAEEILEIEPEEIDLEELLHAHREELEVATEPRDEASNDELTHILIVEDNADVRTFIRTSFEYPFQFSEAADGVEGLEQAYRIIPDLIITDIMMPRMDGVELCTELKQDERTSHIPIIMLTAKADMGSKLEGLDVGADAYITKPFESQELEKRILNLIQVREQLRHYFRREINPLPASMSSSLVDQKFLQRCFDTILEHIEDTEFGVDRLARCLHISRQHLTRKLKALSGETPQHFIRAVRLKRAAQLLVQKPTSILEVAYQVGFKNPAYFSECFHREFGKSPKEFAAE